MAIRQHDTGKRGRAATGQPSVDHVQTVSEIQSILQQAGLRPRKRFGQHFLIDGNLMRLLVETARIGPDDLVLEIGPGTGGLTELLLPRAATVLAVEVDRGLCQLLRQRLGNSDKLALICGDVLDNKNRIAAEVCARMEQARSAVTGATLLVANLPYNVASPLLMNLLRLPQPVDRLCITVQREVAARITALPGTRQYGPLAVALQTAGTVCRVTGIPATAFWPKPRVESTMLRFELCPDSFPGARKFARLVDLVRTAFAHRRKTLRYNLARILDSASCECLARKMDLGRRPETLTVAEWWGLAEETVWREQ